MHDRFHLTSTYPNISCLGTSFKSVQDAIDYAKTIQEFGICLEFSIGCNHEGKYTEIYRTI